jgi:hypothetical protein
MTSPHSPNHWDSCSLVSPGAPPCFVVPADKRRT